MNRKLLLLMLGASMGLPAVAGVTAQNPNLRSPMTMGEAQRIPPRMAASRAEEEAHEFQYTYEGQTLTYTVIDEEAKTCMTKPGYGYWDYLTYVFTAGNKVLGSLVLPSNPKDGDVEYKLVAIGDHSFFSTGLSEVTIPDSVEETGRVDFYDCTELSSIKLPDSLRIIGEQGFRRCISLTSVSLPKCVKSIGLQAFEGCSNLTSIDLGNSLELIERSAFERCSSLPSINLPETVKSIGSSAFNGCSSLTSIDLGNSIELIESGVFEGCSSLPSISLPETVKSIGMANTSATSKRQPSML